MAASNMLTQEQVQQYRSKYLPTQEQPDAKNSIVELGKGFLKGAGSTVKGVMDTVAGGVKTMIPGNVDDRVIDKVKSVQQETLGLTDERLKATNTEQKVGKVAGFAAELLAPTALIKGASQANKVPTLLKSIINRDVLIPTVKPNATIDEVVDAADAARSSLAAKSKKVLAGEDSTKSLAQDAEAASTPITFKEKLAGLQPDVKKRIQGKGPLLADYLNIMDARNLSDDVPTPLEYAASFTKKAESTMQGLLSQKGGQIGKFREKIATYQAPREAFDGVRQSFLKELDGLNLEVIDGAIKAKPGKIAQTLSDTEVSALQKLYDDLNIASRNPSLENLIDLRTKFDNKINFDKSVREVSSTLDPISRSVRTEIAKVAEQIVGKSEADNLRAYSEFIDALNDLKAYTDRNAGAEFLLKRVFSERGGDPRATMETIRQFTGIDLMDHAMMAKIATELSGNQGMQGLFRQELTRAGMDVANLIKGNPVGAIETLFQKATDVILDRRKILEAAAQ